MEDLRPIDVEIVESLGIASGPPQNGNAKRSWWTKARTRRLSIMWADGLPASHIATELGDGITRSAVLGKLHRMRRGVPAVPRARPPKIERSRQKIESIFGTRQRRVKDGKSWRSPPKTEAVELPIEPPPATRVTIWELTSRTCRWPYGTPGENSFCYCGGKTMALGQVYCAFHTKRAWAPRNEDGQNPRTVRWGSPRTAGGEWGCF
jgi:GcrA cell cycle regulator